MPRPPARALVAPALSAAALLSVSACALAGQEQAPPPPVNAPASAAQSPAAAPTLTEAQARAALVTEADLGEPWVPTRGFATWREAMLKATAEPAECADLLDALYAEEFFGADATTRASVGLDDDWGGAQLRYQVVAHRPDALTRAIERLGDFPRRCGSFTATAPGGPMSVEVRAVGLPKLGDARQALRIVLSAVSEYGDGPRLTLDVAAVRVGDDAIAVTNGSLGEVPSDATLTAVELGTSRLEEVRKRGRAEV
ncbi:hypothetical protein ACFXGG_12635 [Streptomyces nigra]|uniref:hypothetical protein n=1 Tax=Streptomyces TaxID=1883 RepID=UPI001F2B8730|nr:hypothetical protein [Streptomyces sp. FB2]MCF2537788.1 hypothetical protein [Streptomyces sp. FB2]